MVKNILIINAHWNNRGDESALRAMIDTLHMKYPDVTFYVQLFTNNVMQFPESSYMHNLQLEFPRKRAVFELPLIYLTKGKVSLLKSTKKYIKLIKNMDLIIHAPGGPSIGEIYRHAEILYLMKFLVAEAVGVPYIFYAPSMGPFQSRFRNVVRKHILESAKLVSVRESVSAEYLRKLKLKNEVHVTIDSAIQKIIDIKYNESLLQEYSELDQFLNKYNRIIGITVTELEWHPIYGARHDIITSVRTSFDVLLNYLSENEYGVLFVPQLFGEQNDRNLMLKYATKYTNTFVMDDMHDCYFQQYIIGQLYAVVGMRYHSNIFSAKMGTPFVSISYEQKMKGFVENIQMYELCINMKDLSPDNLLEKFKMLILKYDEYKEKICIIQEKIKKKSIETSFLAMDVIDRI